MVGGFALAGGREGSPVPTGLVFDQQGSQVLFTKSVPHQVGGGQTEYGLDYRLYFKRGNDSPQLLLNPQQGFPAYSLTVGAAFGRKNEALVLVRQGQDRQADDVLYRVDLNTGARTRLTQASRWMLMDLTFASLKYNAITDQVSFQAARTAKGPDGRLGPQSGQFQFGPIHGSQPVLKAPP